MTPSLALLTEHLKATLASLGVPVVETVTRNGTPDPETTFAAQLTLQSGRHSVSVILATDSATAVELVRAIAGAEVGTDDPLLGDTVGELLNVVAGSARRSEQFTFGIPLRARSKLHIDRQLSRETFQGRRCRIPGGAVDLFLATERTDLR